MTRQEANKRFALTSFLDVTSVTYIEELYDRYKENPVTVSEDWKVFFKTLDEYPENIPEAMERISPLLRERVVSPSCTVSSFTGASVVNQKSIKDSLQAIRMINDYRTFGHLQANLDPLGLSAPLGERKNLSPLCYGFSENDYDRTIFVDNIFGLEYATVRELLERASRCYCSTIGVEFMHLSNAEQRSWIQNSIENDDRKNYFTAEDKKEILAKLIEAEGFEKFVDVKYKGTKRFGLDGGESLIPALRDIIQTGEKQGVKEIVLGMAHRGRLNVLCQIIGKAHRAIFYEFKGGSSTPDDVHGSGDVKYHLGASSDYQIKDHKVHLSLTANPSHLEIVNPVVLGRARAKQDLFRNASEDAVSEMTLRSQVLPVLIHGDAAFAGQGVVAETFELSGLSGYRVAGSIHFIINNQLGFTTNPVFSRSSPYPSDIAKSFDIPVFHVNGDDPEAVIYTVRLATEFRMKFNKPAIVDMFCYRRFGHNEGDEPSFTQPKMYKVIRSHKSVVDIYAEQLIKEGIVSAQEVKKIENDWRSCLDNEFEKSQDYKPVSVDWLRGLWSGLHPANDDEEYLPIKTSVEVKVLKEIGNKISQLPENFKVHKTIDRFIKNRQKMIKEGEGLDWAMAEALAFGSLCLEGHKIRFSGQDCERGTFSQRHAVLYDQETEERYAPLSNLSSTQAEFEIVNSMLSEEAVLGFEYGYSLVRPDVLNLWEAQFGDFFNGAQVILDQFISSGESKWLRMSGLVCLLPHGYEGQGPEHSSARLERFLQLCAENNMQVANCTTPANYFHILRRQLKRNFRKPLIMMTPKSLLRHKRAISSLADMSGESSFEPLLYDDAETQDKSITKLVDDDKIVRVILCTGKVYYDLLEEREKRSINDIYLLRVEQIYPFPVRKLVKTLSRFINAEMVWCQEEPRNMGAWTFVDSYLEWVLLHINAHYKRFRYVGRSAAASPATGLMSRHLEQFAAFIDEALRIKKE
ncbi:2-oxoglutarate dehydrogenase E1 component [Liberibacter crescens BT-1]|uniref:2-oxoglutarate dehydrogenase E1 component n=1 Tax=Liberibacter crescens (strain BT-1) TaxID=1215343 RepID=L0ET70_LIBCB|nr:2-oxoglutarate dehydrogenase E1 component [Liberibacter crescens]AGA64734.1 2-oxoglutarate dehydrogenase E1 component [Liberibacter crescens BT-1]AMC12818.1 2-oxoglutarate dehydrogenase [Liberibacter crescens]